MTKPISKTPVNRAPVPPPRPMGGGSKPPAAGKAQTRGPETLMATDNQNTALGHLEDRLNLLAERLDPVLNGPLASPGIPAPEEFAAPLAHRIQGGNMRIQYATAKIEDILCRLEV